MFPFATSKKQPVGRTHSSLVRDVQTQQSGPALRVGPDSSSDITDGAGASPSNWLFLDECGALVTLSKLEPLCSNEGGCVCGYFSLPPSPPTRPINMTGVGYVAFYQHLYILDFWSF